MDRDRQLKFIEKYTQYRYDGDLNDLKGIDKFLNEHLKDAVNDAVITMIND